MHYFSEAFNELQKLYEDVDLEAVYIDKATGDGYIIKDNKFVKLFSGEDKGEGDDGSDLIKKIEDLLRKVQNYGNKLKELKGDFEHIDDSNIADKASEILKRAKITESLQLNEAKQKYDIEELANIAAELEKELGGIQKELYDLEYDENEDPENETDEDRKNRIEEIKNTFDDDYTKNKLRKETKDRVREDRRAIQDAERAAAAAKRFSKRHYSNPEVIELLKKSLIHALKTDPEEEEEDSYRKINKKYAGTGIVAPGRITREDSKIPTLNVYFDRSSSWGPSQTKFGREAISAIAELQEEGRLIMRLFSFNSDGIRYETEESLALADGTGSTPYAPVYNSILNTNPDNVFIMTDGDFDNQHQDMYMYGDETVRDLGNGQYRTSISNKTVDGSQVEMVQPGFHKVPGMVWMLFNGGESDYLQNVLQGRRGTKPFRVN